MIKVRNALAAGTMAASALVAPMTTPAPSAVADTVASNTSTTLRSAQKPCRKHRNPERCRARHGHGGGHGVVGRGGVSVDIGPGDVGIGGDISDNQTPGNRGGAGIDD
ncbi:hypothetical protein [Streptosporangium amethystogenes]|uniref:hypothetical protein n=1 Tax=Streptosporangium amethystogenes TaxID=2002 RepID=UPI0004C8965F|nr:hypothetical protein [Streptosporangium amethystogenes]